MRQIILVVHNVRSAHNVGSLLRTADGLGVEQVILTGYTPYPRTLKDSRLPHLADKITRRIHKTALGAESSLKWHYEADINDAISQLKPAGYQLVALEQSTQSIALNQFTPPVKTALIVGNEIEGLPAKLLEQCEFCIEIPMQGQKESFNVAAAAAMALYHITMLDK